MIRSAASAIVAMRWCLALTACLGCAAGVLAQQPTAPGDVPVLYLHTEYLPYARGAGRSALPARP